MKLRILLTFLLGLQFACNPPQKKQTETVESKTPFVWQNANIYFLLTDRFNNGDPSNDQQFERKQDGAVLRDFKGGDRLVPLQEDRLGFNLLRLSSAC